jgi:mevalonate kinase
MRAIARAPAKVILLGEHFVVHGGTAIAVALDRGVVATASSSTHNELSSEESGEKVAIDDASGFLSPVAAALRSFLDQNGEDGVTVSIKSEVPPGGGLGSSAASAVAAVAAASALFNTQLTPGQLYDHAMVAEKLVHGNPSGIDVFVSVHGGLVTVRGGERAGLKIPPFQLLVSYSGMTRRTGEMVKAVSSFREKRKDIFNKLMKATNSLVDTVVLALQKGELEVLAGAMNFNHRALQILGASNERLDEIVRHARECGFEGAKLTGAGGGGCIIAITSGPPEKPFQTFSEAYPDSFLSIVPGGGVSSWKIE